mmetsp:Transcript_4236/g.11052  ORF Transcript_4236/g.11052 Transcript_4236/m.11052 type:complete len:107 (-) Transcript_4236:723-1043(-)
MIATPSLRSLLLLLCTISSLIAAASAGRTKFLLETDANKAYSAQHHKSQPRYTFTNPEKEATLHVVPGPTTFSQRRRGWVWVVDDTLRDADSTPSDGDEKQAPAKK